MFTHNRSIAATVLAKLTDFKSALQATPDFSYCFASLTVLERSKARLKVVIHSLMKNADLQRQNNELTLDQEDLTNLVPHTDLRCTVP